METIVITGGTGLVGKELSKLLVQSGYRVILLSRSGSRITPAQLEVSKPGVLTSFWDPAKKEIDTIAIGQADHIINFAGAGVAEKRWTSSRKNEIVDSRVESGRLIVKALQEVRHNVKTVINASAIGWYGSDNSINPKPFTENAPADTGFLGVTCAKWESSVAPIHEMGIRLVRIRIGIVLSKEGGALAEFKKPLRFGIAAILGNGKQIISWIHVEDLCRIFLLVIENTSATGIYNAVAPCPVSNRALTIQMARQRNGSLFIPVKVPAFVLKIIMGEMSVEVLKSTTVSSDRIQTAGFIFNYTSIENALSDLISRKW